MFFNPFPVCGGHIRVNVDAVNMRLDVLDLNNVRRSVPLIDSGFHWAILYELGRERLYQTSSPRA
jgi:hypothetical protein